MAITLQIDAKSIKEVDKWLQKRPQETLKQLDKATQVSIIEVQRQAKINSPVDTGLLRLSISSKQRPLEGEVYAGVEYAIHVHQGTSKMRKRPFLLDAVKALTNRIKINFEKAIKNIINK